MKNILSYSSYASIFFFWKKEKRKKASALDLKKKVFFWSALEEDHDKRTPHFGKIAQGKNRSSLTEAKSHSGVKLLRYIDSPRVTMD